MTAPVHRLAAGVLSGVLVAAPLLAGASFAPPPAAPVQAASDLAAPRFVAASKLVAADRAFRWPLDGTPRVVRRFDPPPRPWLSGHRGVDLAAGPGATVRAAGEGIVRFAGIVAGRGVVSVDHADGLRTTYEPVLPKVRRGDHLRAGDPVGVLAAGHAGCPAPACLHWGLRLGASYLDPLALLGLGRVRLLPLTG